MSVTVQCAGCGQRFAAAEHLYGQRVSCPSCGAAINVPAGPARSAPAPQRPARTASRPRAAQPQQAPARPAAYPAYAPSTQSAGMSDSEKRTVIMASAIGGGVLLLLVLAIGLTSLLQSDDSQSADAQVSGSESGAASGGSAGGSNGGSGEAAVGSSDPDGLFSVGQVPLPEFPELTSPKTLSPSGVKVYFAHAQPPAGTSGGPGMSMGFRVYVPPGEHAEGSLPCVLVAPAGTPLLFGTAMDNDDYHDETLPYATAGMVVIFYGLDGHVPEGAENGSDAAYAAVVARAYPKFKAACAGVVNGRNALEFALAKIPQVDPKRIYCAGHSSAGTLSLLLAAHEQRIARCIAYAPVTDVSGRMAEAAADPSTRELLPGLADFLKQSSPRTHARSIQCPVFLFHARDDSNVPISESTNFVRLLEETNSDVTFSQTPSGDHYQSMVDKGVPSAIEWLQAAGSSSVRSS